jgi:uncharacterized membrane protein YphA (DoxX/SURF4 family)
MTPETSEPTVTTRMPTGTGSGRLGWDLAVLAARCLLGGLMIYLGLVKALHPVDFLKVLRQYELVHSPFWLNTIASTLPWFEVFCGILLVAGVGLRGASLLAILMLVPFTGAVLHRAWGIHEAKGLALCAIRFDCGCGSGEVAICNKLVENGFSIALAFLILLVASSRWCVRYSLMDSGRH